MTLEKVVTVDLIEVLENGYVQVRTRTAILEGGKQISATHHRRIIFPGDDYSKEDARVKAICAAIHTSEVVKIHQSTTQSQGV